MASIGAFGAYLPEIVVGNRELATELNVSEEWIQQVSGISERRMAGAGESVSILAARAAEACLAKAGVPAGAIDLLLVSCGVPQQRFPGPAAAIAHALGLSGTPAIDIPMASAGSIFALSLAGRLAAIYPRILVIAAERMTPVSLRRPLEKNTAILFGDGAGACLVTRDGPGLRILHSTLHSDGAYADDLRLGLEHGIEMNGYSVILQASRKLPAVISEVLAASSIDAQDVRAFLIHQANQNLIDRVAKALAVPSGRFFSNIGLRGNTSSASMLIAASEYFAVTELPPGEHVCFAGFGAGFHWGALLAEAV